MSIAALVNNNHVHYAVDTSSTHYTRPEHPDKHLNLAHSSQDTSATDWHVHPGFSQDKSPSAPSSWLSDNPASLDEAIASYSAVVQPLAPVAALQRFMGSDQISELVDAALNRELPSLPQLMKDVKQLGQTVKNNFLAVTGHVSHVPEQPIHVSDSASVAFKDFGFEGWLGTMALVLGTRKGGPDGITEMLDIKTRGKRQPASKGASNVNREIKALVDEHQALISQWDELMRPKSPDGSGLASDQGERVKALHTRLREIESRFYALVPNQAEAPRGKRTRQELLDSLATLKAEQKILVGQQKSLTASVARINDRLDAARQEQHKLGADRSSNEWATAFTTSVARNGEAESLQKTLDGLERRLATLDTEIQRTESQLSAARDDSKPKPRHKK